MPERAHTQYQVAKEHLAKLDDFRNFLCTITMRTYGIHVTVCPNCNRDAVCYYNALGKYYVDDCFFDGAKWKLKAYCVEVPQGYHAKTGKFIRRTFNHAD